MVRRDSIPTKIFDATLTDSAPDTLINLENREEKPLITLGITPV